LAALETGSAANSVITVSEVVLGQRIAAGGVVSVAVAASARDVTVWDRCGAPA